MRNPPTPIRAGSKKHTRLLSCMLLAGMGLLLGGCEGVQSALDPAGPEAQAIAGIAWAMFWGAAAILLLVMALALYAIYRSPEKRGAPRANTWIAAGGVAFPVVTLSALLLYGVWSMGELRADSDKFADEFTHGSAADPAKGNAAPTPDIEIVGNRWWWEVHYRDKDGIIVSSANEIRIPAGKPVLVSLRSNDVIHSFWVPRLAGKVDLVPGRSNRIVLQADAPGMYRGQCAEYCGAQHARMAFHVIAQAPADHAAWLAAQRAPARPPQNAAAARGREAFLQHCVACHAVRESNEASTAAATGAMRAGDEAVNRGPDLTHVASRQFLAAGTLDNNRDNLLAFTIHSQSIKPGNGMPNHAHLDADTVQAIASYLEGLE